MFFLCVLSENFSDLSVEKEPSNYSIGNFENSSVTRDIKVFVILMLLKLIKRPLGFFNIFR